MYASVLRHMYSCSSARFIEWADMQPSSIACISRTLKCCTYSIISSRMGHNAGASGWSWHLDGSVTIGSVPHENITSHLVDNSLGKIFNFVNADKMSTRQTKEALKMVKFFKSTNPLTIATTNNFHNPKEKTPIICRLKGKLCKHENLIVCSTSLI